MATSKKLPIYSLRIKTNKNVGKELCRFCFKIIKDQDFQLIGEMTLKMLNVLLLEMDLSVDGKFAMCRDCQDCIEKCFNFKLTCLFSEDTILEHKSEGSKVSLVNIYLRTKLQRTFPKDHTICRLCMNVTPTDKCLSPDEFVLVNDMLEQYIPELDLNAVLYPAICKACFLDLESYSRFVTVCLDVEEKINTYCKAKGVDKRQVQLYKVLEFVSNEVCSIGENAVSNREKLDEKLLNTEPSTVKFETIKEEISPKSEDYIESNKIRKCETELSNRGQVRCLNTEQFIINGYVNKNKIDLDMYEEQELSLPDIIKMEIADDDQAKLSTAQNFIEKTAEFYIKKEEVEIESGEDDMSSTNETGLSNEVQVDCPRAQPFILNEYIFIRDKNGTGLVTERKQEKLPVPGVIKEEIVDEDESITQNSMDSSVAEVYIKNEEIEIKSEDADTGVYVEVVCRKAPNRNLLCCPSCTFSTKIQKVFTRHLLIHEGPANTIYKCDDCPFETISKIGLTCHRTKAHINRREKCKFCPYTNKYPFRLKRHELIHKDYSDRPMFKCSSCEFQCLTKYSFHKHLKRHNVDSEIQMAEPNYNWYSCKICSFNTFNHTILTNHNMRFHSGRGILFSCGYCAFKTKLKHTMKIHILTHRYEENIMYNCNQCSYKVKRRARFNAHMREHKLLQNLQMAESRQMTSHTDK